MMHWLKKHWFTFGLFFVFVLVLADGTGTLSAAGGWIRAHGGVNIVICLIFFFSGTMLDAHKLRSGLMEIRGTLAALFLIFCVSPALAWAASNLPLHREIVTGLFIVSVAPTTLSSAVVMTMAAGGHMAHALLVSVLSNALAVLTIPLTLQLLVGSASSSVCVVIDAAAMMAQIAACVLLPLVAGATTRIAFNLRLSAFPAVANQALILSMVWVGISQARDLFFQQKDQVLVVLLTAAGFHLAMLAIARFLYGRLSLKQAVGIGILFTGSQKTLPLTLMVQASAFPGYPLALVVCVVHHLSQLFIDSCLVTRLKTSA